jgi:hypothetical protein
MTFVDKFDRFDCSCFSLQQHRSFWFIFHFFLLLIFLQQVWFDLVWTEWSKFNGQSSNTTQKNFEENIEQCEILENLTPTLTLKNWSENVIPNSISTLTHHTFKLIGFFFGQEVHVNSITSLHNQIETCIIEKVRLTPTLNDKSNPIYTLTKLRHLKLFGCKICELNETISNLTLLQTLLLSVNYELNQLPSSMTKLTSLLHLSLNKTKIQSDTLISVVV